jgi:hypothetical protein
MDNHFSNPDQPARRIRSALYLDFDNIFSGLLGSDAATAMRLARSPGCILEALAAPSTGGTDRDLLVRRAYLNPNGTIESAEYGNAKGVILLSRFRADLVRAGFEVIDCPSLCSGQKNAADIRIVLDVADAAATERYDEFIVASSDSDFTPLLHRLRASDLLTVIVSTNRTSDAYRNAAHTVIGPEQFTDLLAPPPAPSKAQSTTSTAGEPSVQTPADGRSGEPVAAGPVELPDLPEAAPAVAAALAPPEWVELVPATIASLQAEGALPKIPTDRWPVLFEALRAYCREEGFTRNAAAGHVRDRLAAACVPIGRATIERVLRALSFGGAPLDPRHVPSNEACVDAVIVSVARHLDQRGLELTTDDAAELRSWIEGPAADNPLAIPANERPAVADEVDAA